MDTVTVLPPGMIASSVEPGTLVVGVDPIIQLPGVLKSPPEVGPFQVNVEGSQRSSRTSTAGRIERRRAGRFVDFCGGRLPKNCQSMQGPRGSGTNTPGAGSPNGPLSGGMGCRETASGWWMVQAGRPAGPLPAQRRSGEKI
jgi:hypothetical protein